MSMRLMSCFFSFSFLHAKHTHKNLSIRINDDPARKCRLIYLAHSAQAWQMWQLSDTSMAIWVRGLEKSYNYFTGIFLVANTGLPHSCHCNTEKTSHQFIVRSSSRSFQCGDNKAFTWRSQSQSVLFAISESVVRHNAGSQVSWKGKWKKKSYRPPFKSNFGLNCGVVFRGWRQSCQEEYPAVRKRSQEARSIFLSVWVQSERSTWLAFNSKTPQQQQHMQSVWKEARVFMCNMRSVEIGRRRQAGGEAGGGVL